MIWTISPLEHLTLDQYVQTNLLLENSATTLLTRAMSLDFESGKNIFHM